MLRGSLTQKNNLRVALQNLQARQLETIGGPWGQKLPKTAEKKGGWRVVWAIEHFNHYLHKTPMLAQA